MAASCHNNAVGTRSRLGEICDDGSDSYTCNGDTQEIHRSVAAIIPSTVGDFYLGAAVHRACSPSTCAKDAKDTAGVAHARTSSPHHRHLQQIIDIDSSCFVLDEKSFMPTSWRQRLYEFTEASHREQ